MSWLPLFISLCLVTLVVLYFWFDAGKALAYAKGMSRHASSSYREVGFAGLDQNLALDNLIESMLHGFHNAVTSKNPNIAEQQFQQAVQLWHNLDFRNMSAASYNLLSKQVEDKVREYPTAMRINGARSFMQKARQVTRVDAQRQYYREAQQLLEAGLGDEKADPKRLGAMLQNLLLEIAGATELDDNSNTSYFTDPPQQLLLDVPTLEFPENTKTEEFWADKVRRLKQEGRHAEVLQLCRSKLPLTGAFKSAAIALRALIRERKKRSEDFQDLLKQLYELAVQYGFLLSTAHLDNLGPAYKVADRLPRSSWSHLTAPYEQIGYDQLDLLTITDKKMIRDCWSEPQQHQNPQVFFAPLWQELLASLSEQ